MFDRWHRFVRVLSLSALAVLALQTTACTELAVAKYRDDRFVNEYKYTLGEQYIHVDGLKLCYQEQGSGPTVLILPGLGTSIDVWQKNVPALAEHAHVLALDYPGIGKSDKPDASYDLIWMCDRILHFLDAKGVDRFTVIGGSLGGHLGLLLALNHPDRVEKLILMGTVGDWPPPNFFIKLGLKLLWNEWIVTDYLRLHWPDIYPMLFLHKTELTERLYRYQMARRANGHMFAPEGRAFTRAIRSIFYNSCRSRLPDLAIPVLLLWGDSDEVHPPEEGLYFRRHVPDSRLVILPSAAHEAMLDNWQLFNETAIAFLKSGTAGVEDRIPLATTQPR